MLMSASPGRAAAMVPAPVERSELPGHRQQIGKSAALTVGRSPALSLRCGRCGSERSAEFGSVNPSRCPHARARGRADFQRALTQTDLHRPAGRRCGCWPTSTFLFSGIVVGRFGGGRWSSGSAPMLMSASPGRAAAMVPAPVERSELPGHRQQIGKSAALSVGRSPALSLRCGRCGSERSAEFGSVNPSRCPHARANNREQGDC